MSIYPLLQNSSFSPTEIERITDAHEEALGLLSYKREARPFSRTYRPQNHRDSKNGRD
jgi:hypothetical protein